MVELPMDWMVVPAEMPAPVTISPTNSPVVLVMPETVADPLVSVPLTEVDVDGTLASQMVLIKRLSEPETIAFAESVMVDAELLMDWIVVPAGRIPGAITFSPTSSPAVLVTPTTGDPIVTAPV